jgi:tetratricopeptide (TPR) repeat protein
MEQIKKVNDLLFFRRRGQTNARRRVSGRGFLRPLVVAAFLTAAFGWSVHYRLPASCYGRAIEAMDSMDGRLACLEQLQYELLALGSSMRFEPQASLLRAKLLLAQDHCDKALEELKIADSDDETRLRALVLAGEGLYKTGRFRDAGAAWTLVIQRDRENIDAHRWLGVAYYELGTVDAAIHYLSEVARLDPSDARPHRVIGVIWRDLDEYHSAAEAFRQSLARDSTSPLADQVRFDLAQVLNNSQGHVEALKVLTQLAPTCEVRTLRAACWHGLGELDRAAATLDEVLDEAPDLFPALTTRAKIALEKSQPLLAARLAQRAGEIKPRSPEALNLLIATHLRQGDREGAKQCEQLLQKVTDQLDEYHRMVSKVANDPTDVELRSKAGVLAAELGMNEAAKWWLRAALLLEPENRAARDALASMNDDLEPAGRLSVPLLPGNS